MKIEIKSWLNGKVLFKGEFGSLKIALEMAVSNEVDLSYARLDGASLVGASLDGASLVGARLDGARLVGASLVGASLDGARLVGARLDGASLVGASLDGARLDGASLVGARLDGASLVGASLDGARLVGARLDGARLEETQLVYFRDDFWAVLSAAPAEVTGLRKALIDGRVDGSQYEGECACLVGTIAKIKGCKYVDIPALKPNSKRPSEQWFMQIKKGDTPKNSKAVEQTVAWLDEWTERITAAFGGSA